MNQGPVKSFSVYPNPATNKLTVNVGEFIVEGITIFDIQGRKVYADNDPFNGERTINISFEKGIYFLKLTSNIPFSLQKIVVR